MKWLPLLARFAGDPHQRFRLFIVGITLFIISLCSLYSGVHYGKEQLAGVWLIRIGTLALCSSLALCLYCYLSLLVARFLHFWQD